MKKFFAVLGILFLLILITGGIFVGYVAYKGNGLDKESKDFVDNVAPKILSNWDRAEFDSDIDKATMEKVGFTSDQEAKLFAWLQKTLGGMTKYKEAKGQAMINYNNGRKYISAQYDVSAEFKNGPATIKFTLSKSAGEWKIIGFHVSPKNMPN